MSTYHVTAMRDEAVAMLACRPGMTVVDGTLGGCGHALRICEQIAPDGVLVGIDQDRDAIDRARRVLPVDRLRIHIVHGNFGELPAFLSQLGIDAVDGILIDIGLSQHQIEGSGRGFSFLRDEPLDMRMNVDAEITAADLVATLSEEDLARTFSRYGEERWSAKIARHLAAARRKVPIATSGQLARLVAEAVPAAAARSQKIHPATRVFMALRIAVNRELECLDSFMKDAVDYLNLGGRLCVLSFHSLEDRIVKNRMKGFEQICNCPPKLPVCVCNKKQVARRLMKKVVRPSEEEIVANPMARSAKLRAIERIL